MCMKRISIVLIMVCLCIFGGVTVYAAETSVTITPDDPEAAAGAISVVDWSDVDWSAELQNGDVQDNYATETGGNAVVPVRDVVEARKNSPDFYPITVETVTENGTLLVKKTYELSPDIDPQALIQPFEQDGYSFTGREILRRQLSGETLTRAASKTALFDSETDDKAEILKQFPSTIDHEENGYAGQLYLDASSIVTEADSHEKYTYPYTKTREIPGLDRNDPAYIEKQWNGMALADVSFKQGAGGLYTATAVYKGTASGKRATGYVTTATYHGEIIKTVSGNYLYTAIYAGTPIESPEQSEREDAEASGDISPEPSVKEKGYIDPVIIVVSVIFLIGSVFIPVYTTKEIRRERKENREAYKEIARFIRGED